MNSLKKLEIAGKRMEIMGRIEKNPDAEEIVLKTKPSKFLFLLLLNKTKMKKMFVSEAIYKSVSKKYWKALKDVGVKIKVEKRKRGRREYPKKLKRKILKEAKKKGVSKTAKKYGIGRRSIYYWMNATSHQTQENQEKVDGIF